MVAFFKFCMVVIWSAIFYTKQNFSVPGNVDNICIINYLLLLGECFKTKIKYQCIITFIAF